MFEIGRRQILLACGLLVLGAGAIQAQQTLTVPAEMVQFPDLIIHNAKIVTMDDPTPTGPPGSIFQAMAIRGDRIQFLGTDVQVLRYAGPQTRQLDLKGRTVIPGMIDTHTHLHEGFLGDWAQRNPQEILQYYREFNLGGKTFDELTRGIELILKEQMAGGPEGQWAHIHLPERGKFGVGIGTQYIGDGHMTREKLDVMAPDVPLILETDGFRLLNTVGLRDYVSIWNVEPTEYNFVNAGLDGNARVDRTLVAERYFKTRTPLVADILEDGMKHFAAMGFTGFSSHINSAPVQPAYMKLAREGRMPVRFGWAHRFCQVMAVDVPNCFARLGDFAGMGDKYFWNVGVTMGAVDHNGVTLCTTNEFKVPELSKWQRCYLEPGTPYHEGILASLRSKQRFVINHVNGDRSMDIFMDMIDQVMKEDPSITLDYVRAMRFTADHCGMYPRQDQIPRMAKFGMAFSCGVKEINDHGLFIPHVYGEQHAKQIAPLKSMITSGLRVANEGGGNGMDDVNPTTFARWFMAFDRKRYDGVVMAAEEAINRVQMIKMNTVYASYFVLKEKELGTLEPGKFADFIVINKDYFTIPQEELRTVIPLMVVVGGKTIVLREEYAREIGLPAVGPQLKFSYGTPKPGMLDADGNLPDWTPEGLGLR